MLNRFLDRNVFITGALGEAMVRAFAEEGANVVIASRHKEEGKKLAGAIKGRAMSVSLDVTDEDNWKGAVAQIGPVSVLIHNAAYLAVGGVETVSAAEWRKVIDTNLTGAFLGIRTVAPSMRKGGGGSIVNISSIAGLHATPGLVAYGASKWGIRGFTRTAAYELAHDKIRVNAVHPGIINTPLAFNPATGKELVSVAQFAIPRQAESSEIAKYVLFVASDDAAFSTASEFVADGGFGLGPIAP